MTYQPPTGPPQPGEPPPSGPPAPYYGGLTPGVPYGAAPYGGVPAGPPVPPPRGRRNTVVIVVCALAALLVLLCGGGATAVVLMADRLAAEPTPAPTRSGRPQRLAEPVLPLPSVSPSPSRPPVLENQKVGSTLVVADDEGTLEVTLASVKVLKKGCSGYAEKPESGTFLLAEVTLKVTDGLASVNPLYFAFVAPDGNTANAFDGALSDCDKRRLDASNNLRAGTVRKGQLVFDVKAKGQIVYQDSGGRTAGSWQIG